MPDCVNNKHLPYVFAVELEETGELVGDAGGNEVEGNWNEIEIGYGICKRKQSAIAYHINDECE